MTATQVISANWPAPKNIHAFTTTRVGGSSVGPYASLNLGMHVDDNPKTVNANRLQLQEQFKLPTEPLWLQQTHSTVAIDAVDHHTAIEADAIYTNQPKKLCTVMTADCLPILLCNRNGEEVAAIHAGWRGLADGIIENTLAAMQSDNSELMAWLGPAISERHFQVGEEVRQRFIQKSPAYAAAFHQHNDRYLADLYLLANLCLQSQNIKAIYGAQHCTYQQSDLFFSHRRDSQTGRMASLIWID